MIAALSLGLVVGVVLGVVGGGGSIIAVPALVYGVGMSPAEAIPTSLLVVGISSLAALIPRLREGINWNDYPSDFKRGAYFQRVVVERSFSDAELDRLPPNHRAHRDASLTVQRSVVRQVRLPPLRKVVNREEVLFDSAAPSMASLEGAQSAQNSLG